MAFVANPNMGGGFCVDCGETKDVKVIVSSKERDRQIALCKKCREELKKQL